MKTRPRPPRFAPPSFLAPASASGPRLLSGRASPRNLGASAGGWGKRREKGRRGGTLGVFNSHGPSRLLGDVANSGPHPAGEGDERAQEAQSGAKDPESGRGVSFRPDSYVSACGRAESMGTPHNVRDPSTPGSHAVHSPAPPTPTPHDGDSEGFVLGSSLGVDSRFSILTILCYIFNILNSFVSHESFSPPAPAPLPRPPPSPQSPQASASTLKAPHFWLPKSSQRRKQEGSLRLPETLGRRWGIILKYLIGRSPGFLLLC